MASNELPHTRQLVKLLGILPYDFINWYETLCNMDVMQLKPGFP